MNQISGRAGKIRSAIYWGNPANCYSEADATLLPTANPYYSAIADLNDDGFPDIVFTGASLYIYYGGDDGLKPARELPFNGPCVCHPVPLCSRPTLTATNEPCIIFSAMPVPTPLS